MDQRQDEEHTFLFGARKIRCYGSIDDLNSPSSCPVKIAQIIIHKVQPTDTLQNLELRYNSSMFEIKRLNKLWSNQSLYCKSEVQIPIFDGDSKEGSSTSADSLPCNRREGSDKQTGEKRREEESLGQLLKRIDMNMKRTKKAVRRFNIYSKSQDGNTINVFSKNGINTYVELSADSYQEKLKNYINEL